MRPLTLAVDVDEVCAALLPEWLRRYNLAYADTLTADEATEWDMTKVVKPKCGAEIYKFLTPDIYDQVLPIPGARPAIYQLLAAGHRVVYVTASRELQSAQAKQSWLLRWGFLSKKNYDRDFIPANDKSLIQADILFDDRLENVQSFKGCGVLITQKYNEQAAWHYRLPSLSSAPTFVEGFLASW